MAYSDYVELVKRLKEESNKHTFKQGNLIVSPGSIKEGNMNLTYVDPETVTNENPGGKKTTVFITEAEAKFLINCLHYFWPELEEK